MWGAKYLRDENVFVYRFRTSITSMSAAGLVTRLVQGCFLQSRLSGDAFVRFHLRVSVGRSRVACRGLGRFLFAVHALAVFGFGFGRGGFWFLRQVSRQLVGLSDSIRKITGFEQFAAFGIFNSSASEEHIV